MDKRGERTDTLNGQKERPILFSAPMVRAILDGRKTQTRRIVDVSAKKVLSPAQRKIGFQFFPDSARTGTYSWLAEIGSRAARKEAKQLELTQHLCIPSRHPEDTNIPVEDCGCERLHCPYGVAGDRLWVRETFKLNANLAGIRVTYAADGAEVHFNEEELPQILPVNQGLADDNTNRPSIHMPRWASRITLEITKVRVERLQDISEDDAKAEGVIGCKRQHTYPRGTMNQPDRAEFAILWDSINGKGAWEQNPWVWVIEFKLLLSDVDGKGMGAPGKP